MTLNMKQKILIFTCDNKWHANLDIAMVAGNGYIPAWSWNQRKNEMCRQRKASLEYEHKIEGRVDYYRLVTPRYMIDFEKCCLKKEYQLEENGQTVLALAERSE